MPAVGTSAIDAEPQLAGKSDGSPAQPLAGASGASPPPNLSAGATPPETGAMPNQPGLPPGGTPSPPPPRAHPAASPAAEQPPENPPQSEPASFKGVTPGVTSLLELQKLWGVPQEVAARGKDMVYLYAVAPFDHVEVTVRGDRVEAIVIRLNRAFPAQVVVDHLQLSAISPVFVANDRGEVLAQAYPERGVVLAFLPATQPGRATFQTSEIILQPLSGELFALRAEMNLWKDPESSLKDLETAIRLAPALARAHWLRGRILAMSGDLQAAEAACLQAVQLDPLDAAYQLTLGEVLQRQGRVDESRQVLARAEALATSRPHVKARVACALAELATRQSPPDYAKAFEYYVDAIRQAEALAGSEFPAIRLWAKETLLDAYLGAADCIAYGKWRQKEVALPHWWERAERVAADLVENEGYPEDFRFHVVSRAIAACALLKGAVDPSPYADKLVDLAPRLVPESTQSPGPRPTREKVRRRELGQTLYEAAVVAQNRGAVDKALVYAQKAAAYLAPLVEDQTASTPADRFLVGKIFFRIGASHAVGKQDHKSAVQWFDKALGFLGPEVEKDLSPSELGTLGEMLVSMGVSYWETGNQDLGYQLTQRGVRLVESAVNSGNYPRTALAAPYANLGAMERRRGNAAEADRYLHQARQIRGTIQR
ncbi:MAG: tetratricopeptide repeat protein [Thermoguttaceae bacterium]|nr:tetratricopeptide repeat protein [Thermoguttaceae bacterium]